MAKRKCVLTEFEKRKAAFSISSVVCLDYATHPIRSVKKEKTVLIFEKNGELKSCKYQGKDFDFEKIPNDIQKVLLGIIKDYSEI